jgi:hypothetical protein
MGVMGAMGAMGATGTTGTDARAELHPHMLLGFGPISAVFSRTLT